MRLNRFLWHQKGVCTTCDQMRARGMVGFLALVGGMVGGFVVQIVRMT